MVICPFCSKQFSKNGLAPHKPWCASNPNKKTIQLAGRKKGCVSWNKGLTKETDARVAEGGKKQSIKLIGKKYDKSLPSEIRRKKNISATMKSNPCAGGLRKGSGVGKKCWYASKIAGLVYLRSSYELAYVQWLDAQNIEWQANSIGFTYHILLLQ